MFIPLRRRAALISAPVPLLVRVASDDDPSDCDGSAEPVRPTHASHVLRPLLAHYIACS